MLWIRRRRGTLRYAGVLRPPDRYHQWVNSEGRATVQAAATRRWFTLFGAERAAARRLWKELRRLAEQPPLAEMIADEVSSYVQCWGKLAENCASLPRLLPNLRRLVAVPRVLCQAETLERIRARSEHSPELCTLSGGPALRDFFCRELVNQMETVLASAPPTPRKPMVSHRQWLIVAADLSFVWGAQLGRDRIPSGHYFLYESKNGRLTWKNRRETAQACQTLQRQILGLTREERHEILRAARSHSRVRLPVAT
jgi:hypothetical protein